MAEATGNGERINGKLTVKTTERAGPLESNDGLYPGMKEAVGPCTGGFSGETGDIWEEWVSLGVGVRTKKKRRFKRKCPRTTDVLAVVRIHLME